LSPASVFGFLLVLLAAGRILRATKKTPENASETLNIVALYVCMPAAILLHAPHLTFERGIAGVVAVPWILLLASATTVFVVSRLARAPRATRACLMLEIPLGNTAFLGYSVIPALAGPRALRYAVLYDQLGSFLILGTYGLIVVALHSGGATPTQRSVAKRILTFPPFVALALGTTLMPADLPRSVTMPLEVLSSALLPIVGIAVGMQLRLKLARSYIAPLLLGIVGKLVVLPLLALGVCALFRIDGDMRAAAVLESAMPTMMTTGALLSIAGLAPDLAAAIVGYTTILSIVTLPIWQRLLLL
jgi:predicted permease